MRNFHEAWGKKMKEVYADPTARLLPNVKDVQKVRGRSRSDKTYAIRRQIGDQVKDMVFVSLSQRGIAVEPCVVRERDKERLQITTTPNKKLRIRKVFECLFPDQMDQDTEGATVEAYYDQTGRLENIEFFGRPLGSKPLAELNGIDVRNFARYVWKLRNIGIPIPPVYFNIDNTDDMPLRIFGFKEQNFFMIGRHPVKGEDEDVTAVDVSLDRLVLQENSETDDYSLSEHRDVMPQLPLELTLAKLMNFIRKQIEAAVLLGHKKQIIASVV